MASRFVLVLSLLTLCSACSASQDPDTGYLGLKYPPRPAGVESLGGFVLDPSAPSGYSVAHVRDEAGRMLWLERMVHHDEHGVPHVEVVGVQRIAAPGEGEDVWFDCVHEGAGTAAQEDIIAVARPESNDAPPSVRQAWRADVLNLRFVAVPADQVRCAFEGHDPEKALASPY